VSALQIFEELDMWEHVIECYKIMNRNDKAEEIVRSQLEINPTPLMWCILGDLKNDDSAYEKAWKLSGHHFARAKRSLGRSCLSRREWEDSVKHYEVALAINPLYSESWFNMGCACMQLKKWEKAITCFSRVVQISPEEAEAWNNMASIYIQQNKKQEAYLALQESLKNMRNSWRIWQNYLYVCMDIGKFQQAIHAMQQILDLKDKEVDIDILSMLCEVVVKDMPDADERSGTQLKGQLDILMDNISNQVSEPKLWNVFAKYYTNLGDKKKGIGIS